MWVRSPTLDHGTYIVTSPCMAYALRPRIHLGHFWNLDTFISPNLSVGPLVWDHEGWLRWLRHKRQRHNVLICLSRESRRQSSYQVAFRSHLVGAGQFHADNAGKCKMCGQDFVGSSGESPFWGSGISMSLYEKIQSTPCKERVQSTFNIIQQFM